MLKPHQEDPKPTEPQVETVAEPSEPEESLYIQLIRQDALGG